MSSEYSIEQEITLLEQDAALLQETLAELRQQMTVDKKAVIQLKIIELERELVLINEQLAQINKDARSLTESAMANPPATLYQVPTLPPYRLTQSSLFNTLRTALITKLKITDKSVTSKPPLLIQAPSGRGKSLMASMLAHDETVRRTFPDGIIWIQLGQQPDLLSFQMNLIQLLGGNTVELLDTQQGMEYLCQLSSHRSCLLIVDDARDVYEVLMFNVLGKNCQLLITTSDTTLLDFLKHSMPQIQGYTLNPLEEEQAIQFFRHHVGMPNDTSKLEKVREIVRACDYLPLTIKLMASLLRQQPPLFWQERIKILQQAQSNDFPDSHPRTLMQAMQINLDALEEQSEYYLTLAIFINYTHIPQTTVVMLWRYLYHLPTEQAYHFIAKLAEQGLVHLQESHIQLHTFQHDYLYTNCANVESLHTHLLAAYRRHCQHGWASGTNDGYFFQYLCQHLLAAERLTELKSLLLDFDWLRAKWQVCPLHSLLKDYDLLPDDSEINLVKQALIKSAPTLLSHRKQLASQLFKHLKTNYTPDMEKLLNQLTEAATD